MRLYVYEINLYKENLKHLQTNSREGTRQYLWGEFHRIVDNSGKLFLDDKNKAAEADKLIKQARDELKRTEDSDVEGDISKEANLMFVQSRLASFRQLVELENRSQRHEARWQWFALFFIFVYAFLIIGSLVYLTAQCSLADGQAVHWSCPPKGKVPYLDIPPPVLLWAATGSLAAILYRLYTKRKDESFRFRDEFRWLVARPFIGIIMGALSYLAVVAGLVLIGNPERTEVTPGHNEVLWIIAFLAGFSDKFYEGIISLLVTRIAGDSSGRDSENALMTSKSDSTTEPFPEIR